jgi:Photoprotection regulator fluorescence recovery protein
MHDIKWTNSEKKLAREVFESALQKELAEIIAEFKRRASTVSEPDDLWSLLKRTDRKREEIDQKYDFRYSQLLRVFGNLLHEQRISENELHGLSDEKLAIILRIADL